MKMQKNLQLNRMMNETRHEKRLLFVWRKKDFRLRWISFLRLQLRFSKSLFFLDTQYERQLTETSLNRAGHSGKRIYLLNIHTKMLKFLLSSPDHRQSLIKEMARKGFDIVWPETEEGIRVLCVSRFCLYLLYKQRNFTTCTFLNRSRSKLMLSNKEKPSHNWSRLIEIQTKS